MTSPVHTHTPITKVYSNSTKCERDSSMYSTVATVHQQQQRQQLQLYITIHTYIHTQDTCILDYIIHTYLLENLHTVRRRIYLHTYCMNMHTYIHTCRTNIYIFIYHILYLHTYLHTIYTSYCTHIHIYIVVHTVHIYKYIYFIYSVQSYIHT